MADPPKRKSVLDLEVEIPVTLAPDALEALEAAANVLTPMQAVVSEVLAGVDFSGLAEALAADREAIKRALPSREDYWVDFWAFSVTPLPWGLGLTPERLWSLDSREWLALYRVWKSHDEARLGRAAAEPPANSAGYTGLRRGLYPFGYWLHGHETLPDPKAELDHWTAHVWRGFHALIDGYAKQTTASAASRHEKLSSATTGLSYDLAVLRANHVIDRGLRGDGAMQAYRDEAKELLEEVTSAWRAAGERLAVEFEDEAEAVNALARPFHRVRDDLRRLLAELPPAEGMPAGALPSDAKDSPKPNVQGQKRGPKTDHETNARIAEVVATFGPDWPSKWRDVAEALDKAEIACPSAWRKKTEEVLGPHGRRTVHPIQQWSDQEDRSTFVKLIEYRLASAREKSTPESLG